MNTTECVDPSVHGNPFRYCPYCDWREPEPPPTGAQMIAAERQRQIDSEGWTAEHDDEHSQGELAGAAVCYIVHALQQEDPYIDDDETWPLPQWPWGRSWWKPSGDPTRNLTKAGALIAAEIDRIQRLQGAS